VVKDGEIATPEGVRRQFNHLKPLAALPADLRGWTLNVLNLVRRVVECSRRGNEALTRKSKPEINQSLLTSSPTKEFTNEDLYAFERELAALHPGNRHIRDKIRQQLQVLRDAGLLQHTARGRWVLPV
jgi:type II restriction enzyme